MSAKSTKRRAVIARMLALCIICTALPRGFCFASGKSSVYRVTSAHLEPVNREEAKSYRIELERLLFLTPADYGRILVRPSEAPEFSVAVYSEQRSGPECIYRVTLTQASNNVWHAFQETEKTQTDVRVVRCDALIPEAAATAIKSAWYRQLRRIRESPPSAMGEQLGGEIVEFSLSDPPRIQLTGELPTNPNETLLTLQRIGGLLMEYCKAPSDRRRAILPRIADLAKSISG